MATLDSTVGGAAANSWVSVQEADTYLLEERLGAKAWDEVEDKPAALIWATRILDRYTYSGERTSTDQALSWPRRGATYTDGRTIADDEIPGELIRAVCDLAFWLTQDDRTAVPGGEDLEELEAGPVKLKFRDRDGAGGLYDQVPQHITAPLSVLMPGGVGPGSPFRRVLRA